MLHNFLMIAFVLLSGASFLLHLVSMIVACRAHRHHDHLNPGTPTSYRRG